MRRPSTAARDSRILTAMQPGLAYTTREVSAATGLTIPRARDVLERMATAGEVLRIEPACRGVAVNWRRRD